MRNTLEYGITIARRVMIVAMIVFLCTALTGCNAQQKAQHLSGILQGILNVAQAEEAVLPPADVANVSHWVTLGFTLDNQLNTCITASGNKTSKLVACFNAFGSGLVNQAELSNLRIVSSGSQSRVQLWATAAMLAVNAALTQFGATSQPLPSITAPATTAELKQFVASSYHVDFCPGGTPEIHGDSATQLTVTCR